MFDHLQKLYFKENLALGHAEDETGFLLTGRDALNPSAVDFSEIAGVVKDKRCGCCEKTSGFSAAPDRIV